MRSEHYPNLLVEAEPGPEIVTVAIDRADRLNMLDGETQRSLASFLFDVSHDSGVKVVVLTGVGASFCSGADRDHLHQLADQPEQLARALSQTRQLLLALLECPKVVIAKLNGDAIGLGATLALFSDIAVAAEHARIGACRVQPRISAGDGGALLWPHLVGFARARQPWYRDDLFSATEAAEMRLIADAVPAEALDAVVDDCARRLGSGAIEAIRDSKAAANQQLTRLLYSVLNAPGLYERPEPCPMQRTGAAAPAASPQVSCE
ncbi:enoyl-CoA hydratase/isomerase family protein [Solimonas soli]|jgi:enoyl-CoA hydratase|uniref:enoyl-CoA hydratase/isomerase family protein n=1 Tax=Solimonas soli TaxID=413479 RepID=UPI0004BC42D5|nr:enoyl-CoA hydratase/isomerase family protein [Solimonas soli]